MKLVELIYLACPFRHADPKIQAERCAAAHRAAAQLFNEGRHVFSPLTHNELLIEMLPHVPGEHWMQFDLAILAHCKYLYVLKVDGWEQSKGVQREITFAKERGIQIEMIEPSEFDKAHPNLLTSGLNHRRNR